MFVQRIINVLKENCICSEILSTNLTSLGLLYIMRVCALGIRTSPQDCPDGPVAFKKSEEHDI